MTKQDEIIEMARQAGIGWGEGIGGMPDFLKAFAKLIEERKLKEVSSACERLPFGDTAQSFAIWIREQA
jgi:hypothetical protein